MRYLVLGHLGIGDHIMMNGLIHHLVKITDSEELEEVRIMAADDYRKGTLVHLYEEFPFVRFHWMQSVPDDEVFKKVNNMQPCTPIEIDGKEYIVFAFGLHSYLKNNWLLPGHTWIDAMYTYPLNIPPKVRFTEFQCPRNLERAKQKYDTLCQRLGTSTFVLLHDDPSRDRFMNYELVTTLLKNDGMSDYPIVYLGKDRYSYPTIEGFPTIPLGTLLDCVSLFDLTYIVKAAAACHLMDSSIACLVDVLQVESKLYMHSYMMHNTGKAFTRQPWVRLET